MKPHWTESAILRNDNEFDQSQKKIWIMRCQPSRTEAIIAAPVPWICLPQNEVFSDFDCLLKAATNVEALLDLME